MNDQAAVTPISVIQYHTVKASARNRITLGQHLFSFLLEGQKTINYAGAAVQINPGQFLLLSAGNCLMSEKTVSPTGAYQSLLISFETRMLTDFFAEHSAFCDAPAITIDEPFLLFESDEFLGGYIASLRNLLQSGKTISPQMQKIKLNELLLYICENYPGQLQKLRNVGRLANDELLIRQAVTATINTPVSVEELAFLCHASLSTFKRRFSDIYGTSPNKWLLAKRMEKAARLLKQSDQKVSEVYLQVGYENLSSFIQSFKQVYGLTPKQYQSLG
jgi:AraC-like DNA-binding protein